MTAWADTAAPARPAGLRVRAWLAREAAPLGALAAVAALVLATLPYQLAQDGWLSLVAGREVAAHGLPHVDRLTALGAGHEWIDQQWLAHLALYGAAQAGGVGLLLALHALLLVGTFALATVAARRLGGEPATVALLLVTAAVAAPWAWQLRAQTLALPLAVGVLWLLAADARAPSRRVLLVLPLLVVWANVHGSVLLGTALAVAAGAVALAGRRLVGIALVAAPATALASPYGLDLVGYYRRMLGNDALAAHVVEWQWARPGAATAVFYVLAAAAVALAARRGHAFDRLALPLLALAGAAAIRNVVWLALAALVLVPALAARRGGAREERGRAMPLFAGAASLLAAGAAVPAVGAPARVERLWPSPEARLVAAAPGRVLADERLADWLLWAEPSLAGRIALDARFELLEPEVLERVADLRAGRGSAALAGADVVVLRAADRRVVAHATAAGFGRAGGERLAILVRYPAAATPSTPGS